VEKGLRATGIEEVGLLSLSSADHTEIGDVAKGLADRYEEEKIGLSLPTTRVDAFNVDLANELTRNGRRTGHTFAPEGGSER
ncbi:TIGR03960 family B12-binding radical SAM protein, partial [Streptomyces sp. DT18]